MLKLVTDGDLKDLEARAEKQRYGAILVEAAEVRAIARELIDLRKEVRQLRRDE